MSGQLVLALTLILCISAGTTAGQDSEGDNCQPKPQCQCTEEYEPVCGTNKCTYSNKCVLQCDQQSNQNLQEAHEGPCERQKISDNSSSNNPKKSGTRSPSKKKRKPRKNSSARKKKSRTNPSDNNTNNASNCNSCPCTRDYHPVCGTDKQTYANPCLLKCNQKRCKRNLKHAYDGPCKEESSRGLRSWEETHDETCSSCECTREYAPVCGTDNRTYSNLCLLECHQKNCNNNLEKARNGTCDSETGASPTNNNGTKSECKPDCVCTADYNPVCGTNGKTYSNRCQLECDKQCNQGIRVAHKGQCTAKGRKRRTKKPRNRTPKNTRRSKKNSSKKSKGPRSKRPKTRTRKPRT